jgi:hypothetical protein
MSKPVAVGASGVLARAGPVVDKRMTIAMTTTNEDFVKRECTWPKPRSVENVSREKILTVI